MKIRIAYVLIALLVAGTAGIAWAAQPAVDQPSSDAPKVEAPDQGETIIPAQLDGLFVEPTEQYGACCRGDCFAEKQNCLDACDFGDQYCEDQCHAAYDACILNC